MHSLQILTNIEHLWFLLSLNLVADVTDVALEWAERNVRNNPHMSELIEIRKVPVHGRTLSTEDLSDGQSVHGESITDVSRIKIEEARPSSSSSFDPPAVADASYCGPPILLGVVRDGEKFDFCMCNPPFFESIEEAGMNPKTSCGGTPEEMVCPGGEKAFITRIIEDSVALNESVRYNSWLCICYYPYQFSS